MWYGSNSANVSITKTAFWWLMSPSFWSTGGNTNIYIITGKDSRGYIYTIDVENYIGLGDPSIRPVISLKACVKYSRGDGTSSSPYEVTIDDTCASKEN